MNKVHYKACPPIARGVGHHNVVVLIDAHHRARGAHALEHAVSPAPVPVLKGLHDLQLQVHVNLGGKWDCRMPEQI